MLYLKRNIVNEVVYTATEIASGTTFTLELENQQSLIKTTGITLYNVSAMVDRYDMSYIIIPTATTISIDYSGTTTTINGLDAGYYNYIISSNSSVLETGKCLVEYIPDTNTSYTPANQTIVYDPTKK